MRVMSPGSEGGSSSARLQIASPDGLSRSWNAGHFDDLPLSAILSHTGAVLGCMFRTLVKE